MSSPAAATGRGRGRHFMMDIFMSPSEARGGRILKVSQSGTVTPLVEDLPSTGDHHTNGPVVGSDGYVYFGQGTATNSGIVGVDNYQYGWLRRYPRFHDIPAKDVVLTGVNYESLNPFSAP